MALPITLIVDDPAPCLNIFWWHQARRSGTTTPEHRPGLPVARHIPVSFLDRFVDVIGQWGVRGKFTVLPYPAGLGPIDTGWPGCPGAQLQAWIERVQRHVMPLMDITPEILTHAQTLDLDTRTLLPESEREWSAHQSAATLTPYITLALQLLAKVGLPATGVTSPWDFGVHVEGEYQAAIRQSMQSVQGQRQNWYFLHSDTRGTRLRSQVVWRQGDAWLVSLWAQVDDFCWATMETPATEAGYVAAVADQYLTRDGHGRLADLFAAGTPMVMVTHWQSLFADGRHTGLAVLDEVARRVAAAWGEQVQWTSCSQLAASVAAGRWAGPAH
jgi:hypothetical protein